MQCDGCTKMTPMKVADVVGANNIFLNAEGESEWLMRS